VIIKISIIARNDGGNGAYKKRIHTKVQYPILNYKVDFLLPELKVALEIDGGLHNSRLLKIQQEK
jgi:Uncharacterized protein conserved in bacteria